jgi:hypothetical protein
MPSRWCCVILQMASTSACCSRIIAVIGSVLYGDTNDGSWYFDLIRPSNAMWPDLRGITAVREREIMIGIRHLKLMRTCQHTINAKNRFNYLRVLRCGMRHKAAVVTDESLRTVDIARAMRRILPIMAAFASRGRRWAKRWDWKGVSCIPEIGAAASWTVRLIMSPVSFLASCASTGRRRLPFMCPASC